MKGKLVGGFIVFVALATGIAVYWLQEYAYYHEAAFNPGAEILLTPIESDQPEVILAQNVQGIDAESSPLRFRARRRHDAEHVRLRRGRDDARLWRRRGAGRRNISWQRQ